MHWVGTWTTGRGPRPRLEPAIDVHMGNGIDVAHFD
jgi:hypothetical protein